MQDSDRRHFGQKYSPDELDALGDAAAQDAVRRYSMPQPSKSLWRRLVDLVRGAK